MAQITKHSAFIVIAYFLTSGLNYAFSVGLSWFFTPEEYGMQGVAQSLLLLLALVVGSGFSWMVAHDLAAGGEIQTLRRRFRTAWLVNGLLGLSLAFLLWITYISDFLPLGVGYLWIVPLLGATVVLLGLRAVSNGAMRGLYHFGALAVNLTGEVVIKVVIGLGLVALGWGVTGVMVGFAAGAFLSLLHSLWVIRPASLFEGRGWIEPGVIRQTIPLFISMLGVALMLNLDVLGLKLLSPVAIADRLSGYYQAAVVLARLPVFLAQAVIMVLFSYLATSQPQSREQPRLQALSLILRPWLRFLLPVGLVLIAAPRIVLLIFFPPQYQASASVLQLAALGSVLLALSTLINGLMQAQGQRTISAGIMVLATLAQLLVLIWLVPGQGAWGAAISLVAAGGIALLAYGLHFRTELLSAMRHVLTSRESFIRVLLHGAPLLGLLFALIGLPGETWGQALFKILLSGCFYLIVLVLAKIRVFDPSQPRAWIGQFLQVVLGG